MEEDEKAKFTRKEKREEDKEDKSANEISKSEVVNHKAKQWF